MAGAWAERVGPVAPGALPDKRPPVIVAAFDLDILLAVAALYVDAFRPGDYMSLAERIALHDVEDILTRYGRRQ
jgi:hypothetical protein